MPHSPKSAAAMTNAEYRDFVDQMYAAVREEASLHELAKGVTDRLPRGAVIHGPWRPEDCSTLLSRWHDDALLSLYTHNEDGSDGPPVPDAEAAIMLRDPARWLPPTSWREVIALRVSDIGAMRSVDEWGVVAARSTE